MGNDEQPDGLTAAADAAAPDRPADAGAGAGRARAEPERRCILSGERAPRGGLIRLALGPDGTVHPDVRGKAPGRGAWIGVTRAELEQAVAKGRLKGALARAFKGPVAVPAGLAEAIEQGLARATLDRLGLEARGGTLLTGSDRIGDAARKGQLALLLHAADAAADGSRKLDQAWRVGRDAEGSAMRGLTIPAGRAILSMALGRENVVHVGIIAPAAAARVGGALDRWRRYIGWDDEASGAAIDTQGAAAHGLNSKGLKGTDER
ncbi:MAG: DUF448 domain-containing protein [Sphingomonas fennica]